MEVYYSVLKYYNTYNGKYVIDVVHKINALLQILLENDKNSIHLIIHMTYRTVRFVMV